MMGLVARGLASEDLAGRGLLPAPSLISINRAGGVDSPMEWGMLRRIHRRSDSMKNPDRDISGPIISRIASSSYFTEEKSRPLPVGFRLPSC